MLAEVGPIKISVNFAFLANFSYSLHPIKLKLVFQLDHDVEQHIFFFEFTVHQMLAEVCPLKISVNFSFPANYSYS